MHTLIGLFTDHNTSYLATMNKFHALLGLLHVARFLLPTRLIQQALSEIKWVPFTESFWKAKSDPFKATLCSVPEFVVVLTGVIVITNYQLSMRL